MNNLIVNADDLGMTPGTNRAIFESFDRGCVTHTSIMSNGEYFLEAVEGIKARKGLCAGVHLNLTYGKALHFSQCYSDRHGVFNLGYLSILLKSLSQEVFLNDVKKEFEQQIVRVLNCGIVITHLDSHRHVHLIPGIYSIVADLAVKYDIKRVRLITENFMESLRIGRKYDFFLNGGLIKFLLLKTFSKINTKKANLYGDRRFYSILYTGLIDKSIFERIHTSGHHYEVMVHPGVPELDRDILFYDQNEKIYRISQDRERELNAVL